MFLAVPTDTEFAKFAELAGATQLASDARFATAAARKENDAALAEELAKVLKGKSADDWEQLLATKGVGCVRADGALPGDFWAFDKHVLENNFVVSAPHLRYGDYLRWGPMVQLSRSPLTPAASCLAGDHTDAILTELGYGADDIASLRQRGIAWSEPIDAIS